jgi:nucleoid DNA-binding protein/nucleoid-associated protein YgaU
MNEKIALQQIAELLAEKTGVETEKIEKFLEELVSIVYEGITKDRMVKVKEVGTFKVLLVKERESVHINTGKRIVIPEHHKLSFLPEKTLKELINKQFSFFEAVEVKDEENNLITDIRFAGDDEEDEELLKTNEIQLPAEDMEEPDLKEDMMEKEKITETEEIMEKHYSMPPIPAGSRKNDEEQPLLIGDDIEEITQLLSDINKKTDEEQTQLIDEPIERIDEEQTQLIGEPIERIDEEQTQLIGEPIERIDEEQTQLIDEPIERIDEEQTQLIGEPIERIDEEQTQLIDESAETAEEEQTQLVSEPEEEEKIQPPTGKQDKKSSGTGIYIKYAAILVTFIILLGAGIWYLFSGSSGLFSRDQDRLTPVNAFTLPGDSITLEQARHNTRIEAEADDTVPVDSLSDSTAVAPVTTPSAKPDSPTKKTSPSASGKKSSDNRPKTPASSGKTTPAQTQTATPPASGNVLAKVSMTSGSRLTLLALKYYGDKIFWVYIYEYNKAKIGTNPDHIPVGMEILIPAKQVYGIDANSTDSREKAREIQAKLKGH